MGQAYPAAGSPAARRSLDERERRAIITAVARWKRWVALLVVGTLEAVQWGFALALFVTGAVMWRDWHVLGRTGVAMNATVEDCTRRTMFGQRIPLGRDSGGYFSCHYAYPDPGSGVTHRA